MSKFKNVMPTTVECGYFDKIITKDFLYLSVVIILLYLSSCFIIAK